MCTDCRSEPPDEFKISDAQAVAIIRGCFVLSEQFESFSKLGPDEAVCVLEMWDYVISEAMGQPYNEHGVTRRRYGDDPENYAESYHFSHFQGAEIAIIYRQNCYEIYDFAFPNGTEFQRQMLYFEELVRKITATEVVPEPRLD